MQSIFILALFVPVALANLAQVVDHQDSISLIHRTGRSPLGAQLSLDCAYGDEKEQYQITFAVNDDKLNLSPNSYIELIDQNGKSILESRVNGSGDLVLSGLLRDLNLEAVNKNCNGSGAATCGAIRKGKLAVKQLFQVPDTLSKLYWPSFYHVEFECRVTPKDPEGPLPLQFFPVLHNMTQCVQFHYIAISFIDGPISRVNFDLRPNAARFRLDSCDVKTSLGEKIPILANGHILKVPNGEVSGHSIGGASQYELSFVDFTLPEGSANAVVNCQIAYCRSVQDTVNVGLPFCPIGDIPRAAGTRTFLNLNRTVKQIRVNAVLEIGKVTLVVAGNSTSQIGKECPK